MVTSEGLISFMAPVARIELKTGGAFQSNYKVGSKLGDPGTIRNQVLSYLPLEMLSLKIELTEQFPPGPQKRGDSPAPYIIALICNLVLAYVLAWIARAPYSRPALVDPRSRVRRQQLTPFEVADACRPGLIYSILTRSDRETTGWDAVCGAPFKKETETVRIAI
jgi:hypothetical protein